MPASCLQTEPTHHAPPRAAGKLGASALEVVKAATSPDVHHATGAVGGVGQALLAAGVHLQPACRLPSTAARPVLLRRKPTGVEVSPGVFKDVPGEVKKREGYVFAHTPGGPVRESHRLHRRCMLEARSSSQRCDAA